MHYAAENGRVKVVNWLVEDGGMQISAVDAQGQTAMHYAAKGAHSSALEALRSLSSKIVNCKDNRGVTPLMLLVEASDDPRLLDRFVRYGAAVNAVDEEGETAVASSFHEDAHDDKILRDLVKNVIEDNKRIRKKLASLG